MPWGHMPRVLIIERKRHPRSGKKTFKQTIEFVSARSLPRRLKRLQKSGAGAIIQRSFSRLKKKWRSRSFF
jgi:DNA-binding HxlR family transcriptional regulator